MNERHFEILKEIIIDFNEYSTDYTKTRCEEIEQVLIDTLDYITNLQEENERLKEQCKEWKENHKAVCIQRDNILNNIVKDTEDRIDYKSRNEKAINDLDILIEIIYQQPTENSADDLWLLDKLNGIKFRLNGGDEEC